MLYLCNHNHVNIKIVYCQPAELPMTLYYPSSKIVTEIRSDQMTFFMCEKYSLFVVSKMCIYVFSHLVCSNILDMKTIISQCKHAPPPLGQHAPMRM